MLLPLFSSAASLWVSEETYLDYLETLGDRSPLAIDYYGGEHSRREVVELILLQQALHLGGYRQEIEIKHQYLSYRRLLSEVAKGGFTINASSAWGHSVRDNPNVVMSAPIIRRGEYEAGIYTSPVNTKALATKNLEQLRRLSAVTNRGYEVDWKTLQELGVQEIHHTVNWSNMVKMVASQRADFMLMGFRNTEDLSLEYKVYETLDYSKYLHALKLVPVPGVKLYLDGTRHYLLNREQAEAGGILKALNRGIAILRERGVITRALTEAGFLTTEVKDWKVLNPSR